MPPKYRPSTLHDPLHPGPWRHRFVAAHGARFHLAEIGDGPLVVFLHGHHTYWWLWQQQLTALATAGYRAVALDLRGFGASDKPPHGYDLRTMSGDVAGVIRALGGEPATLVGIGAGRCLAHAVAAAQPDLTPHLIAVVPEHTTGLRQRPVEPRMHRFERGYLQRRATTVPLPHSATAHEFAAAAALPFAPRSHKGVSEWMGHHAPTRETSAYLAHMKLPPQVSATRCVIPATPPLPRRSSAMTRLTHASLALRGRAPLPRTSALSLLHRGTRIPADALAPHLTPAPVTQIILAALPHDALASPSRATTYTGPLRPAT